MVVPILYVKAARYLSQAGLRDLKTGEVFITIGAARGVLGGVVRVRRCEQVAVLKDLEGFGLIAFENRNLIKVVPGSWSEVELK